MAIVIMKLLLLLSGFLPVQMITVDIQQLADNSLPLVALVQFAALCCSCNLYTLGQQRRQPALPDSPNLSEFQRREPVEFSLIGLPGMLLDCIRIEYTFLLIVCLFVTMLKSFGG